MTSSLSTLNDTLPSLLAAQDFDRLSVCVFNITGLSALPQPLQANTLTRITSLEKAWVMSGSTQPAASIESVFATYIWLCNKAGETTLGGISHILMIDSVCRKNYSNLFDGISDAAIGPLHALLLLFLVLYNAPVFTNASEIQTTSLPFPEQKILSYRIEHKTSVPFDRLYAHATSIPSGELKAMVMQMLHTLFTQGGFDAI